MVARVRVGQEGFAALGDPDHRPPRDFRRPQHAGVLRIRHDLHAERAADVAGHDIELLGTNVEDLLGKAIADEEHALARRMQEIAVGGRVVARPGAARLERRDRDAVVDDIEADDTGGAGERLLGRLGVAGRPVERRVVRRLRPDLRAGEGGSGVRHRRKRLIRRRRSAPRRRWPGPPSPPPRRPPLRRRSAQCLWQESGAADRTSHGRAT